MAECFTMPAPDAPPSPSTLGQIDDALDGLKSMNDALGLIVGDHIDTALNGISAPIRNVQASVEGHIDNVLDKVRDTLRKVYAKVTRPIDDALPGIYAQLMQAGAPFPDAAAVAQINAGIPAQHVLGWDPLAVYRTELEQQLGGTGPGLNQGSPFQLTTTMPVPVPPLEGEVPIQPLPIELPPVPVPIGVPPLPPEPVCCPPQPPPVVNVTVNTQPTQPYQPPAEEEEEQPTINVTVPPPEVIIQSVPQPPPPPPPPPPPKKKEVCAAVEDCGAHVEPKAMPEGAAALSSACLWAADLVGKASETKLSWTDGFWGELLQGNVSSAVINGVGKIVMKVLNAATSWCADTIAAARGCPPGSNLASSAVSLDILLGLATKWLGLEPEHYAGLKHLINYNCPNELPGPGEANDLYAERAIPPELWKCWVRAGRLDDSIAAVMVNAKRARPSLSEIYTLRRWGVIGADEWEERLKEARVQQDIDMMRFTELHNNRPLTGGEAKSAFMEHLLQNEPSRICPDDEQAVNLFNAYIRDGYSSYAATVMTNVACIERLEHDETTLARRGSKWKARYDAGLISRDELADRLEPFFPEPSGRFQQSLKESDYDREYVLRQKDADCVRKEFDGGRVNSQEAITQLVRHGFDLGEASILVGEWDCQRIPAQRDLSVSEIKRSYDLGLLTRPAVESRLNRLGWVNGAAESITTLWDIDATEARQKALQAVQKQADNQLTEQLKIDTHNIVKEGAEIEKDFARVEKDIQTGLSIAQKAASAEQKGIEGEVSDAFKIDVKNAVAEGTAIEKDAAALDKQVAGAKKKKTTTSKKKPATGA